MLIGAIVAFGSLARLSVDAASTLRFRSERPSDPILGAPLALGPTDVTGRPFSPRGRLLVIFGGACTSCSLRTVAPRSLPERSGVNYAVVYVSQIRDDVVAETRGRDDVWLFSRPMWEIESGLFPRWVGRWYVFQDGRLVRFASEPGAELPL